MAMAVTARVPIFLGLLFAAGLQHGAGQPEGREYSPLEETETPAIELLQRSAKVVHVSKKPAVHLEPHIHQEHGSGHSKLAATTTLSASDSSSFGISANGVGNLPIFLSGLATDFTVSFVCMILFWVFSRRYPIMYRDHILKGTCPEGGKEIATQGLWGWAVASWNLTIDECWETAGLDHAMLLEFANLGLNLFKWIAIPMFCIMGPMNCAFGGNAAGQDHESWFSMGNVEFYCWLYWPISLAIWYVVLMTTRSIHNGMEYFMPKRFQWLQNMDKLRANTIMMLGIPPEQQSDEACKAFWDKLLPGGRVEAVHLTKDTSDKLQSKVAEKDDHKYHLKLAEADWEKEGKDPEKRPQHKLSSFGAYQDSINYYTDQIKALDPEITEARNAIAEAAKKLGSPNLSTGFITFKSREDAEIALRLDLSNNVHIWILDYPPQPQDIIWSDLTQDPYAEGSRVLLGYALTAGMVIIYMPLVVFICNVAEMINLGPLQPIWSSEAPAMGLTIMVDFLPTILHIIFKNCFSLYDKTQSQFKLGVWYFWMNVLYVVLITALGTNFIAFATTLSKDPLRIFSLLADTMPSCTHYYMNYIGMQMMTHPMVLSRYMPLSKYRAFLRSHEEQEAKDMAEPEDQDYYGMGARCARWSTMMCIGLVYGTLSPPVSVLTWIIFFIIRVIYGYQFCFAETKKSDLGGIFFPRALHNTFIALHIYMILMVGVLSQRGSNSGPALICCLAWGYIFHSQKKFGEYKWERLPFPELSATHEDHVKHKTAETKGTYVQPELID